MKKYLKLTAWASGGVAAALMFLGVIAVLTGGVLMGHHWSNLFYPAEVFLLLGIFLLIVVRLWKD